MTKQEMDIVAGSARSIMLADDALDAVWYQLNKFHDVGAEPEEIAHVMDQIERAQAQIETVADALEKMALPAPGGAK